MLEILESDEQAPMSVVLGALPGVLTMTNKVAESASNLVSVEREDDGEIDEATKRQNLENVSCNHESLNTLVVFCSVPISVFLGQNVVEATNIRASY